MKSPLRRPALLLGKTCLLALVSTSPAGAQTPTAAPAPAPTAPAALPAVPFEALVTREAQLFRKKKPEEEDVLLTSPGHVFTVSELAPEQTWKGEKAPIAEVHPYAQATYYMLLPALRPLGPGEVVAETDAAALLFPKQLGAERAWCQRFTGRVLLPPSAKGAKGEALVYSASSDTACKGFMALMSGVGKAAKARTLPRRGAIQSVTVHEVPGAPPLLDIVESLSGKDLSGWRRILLSLERSGPKELLAVELERYENKGETQRNVRSQLTLTPSAGGLDIEVARTERQVALATGAVSGEKKEQKRYRYAAGKLTSRP